MFKKILKTRLRWRTVSRTSWLTIMAIALCLLGLTQPHLAMTPDDYDSASMDTATSIGGEASNNDDIYEPALLQQEVEASEQRTSSSFEEESTETERPHTPVKTAMPGRGQSTIERMKEILKKLQTQRNESRTANDGSLGMGNDSDVDHDMNAKHGLKHQLINSAESYDDSAPEHGRRGKTSPLGKSPKDSPEEDTVEGNSSASLEYPEDDQLHEQSLHRKRLHTIQAAEAKRRRIDEAPGDNEPTVMRFYQGGISGKTADNQMTDHWQASPEQQLPRQRPAKEFSAQGIQERAGADKRTNKNNQHAVVAHASFPLPIATSDNNGATWSIASTIAAPVAATTSAAEAAASAAPAGSVTEAPKATPPTATNAPAVAFDTTFPTPLLLGGFLSAAAPAPTPSPHTPAVAAAEKLPLPEIAPALAEPDLRNANYPPEATTAPVAVTASPAAITTMRPIAGKQGKQINITRRKLLPHEQLRNYIEDAYIRMPLAVIVDPSSESLEKTKALWREALRSNYNIKIVLVSLNASGAPAAYNFNNTRQFLAGLNSIKEHPGGDAFIGIWHASELVPYDSAVFISTASIPPHTELVQDAAITLLKKRIRLYMIWFGERALSENETQDAVGGILGEVAIRSGGEILHIVGSDSSQEIEGNTLVLVADAFRGSQEIDVPVDTTLSSLHVKIDSPMRTATLETPHGDINLKKLVKFKTKLFAIENGSDVLDAFVPLTKLHKSTTYKLKMIPENLEAEYSVFVRAERKADQFLNDLIKRFDSYFLEGIAYYPTRFRDARMQSITSALATISMPTHDNLKFPGELDNDLNVNRNGLPKSEVETFSSTEIHTKADDGRETEPEAVIINNTIAADISKHLNQQQRQSSANGGVLQQSFTRIELAPQSQVLVTPGMMSQLIFEIRNLRPDPVFYSIQVVDERRYLLRLSSTSLYLQPDTTASVSVTLVIPSDAAQGITDRVTLSCRGSSETLSQSVNLRVITNVDVRDNTSPSITYTYGSRCEYISADSATCAERFWAVDITAQDWESGILRLQTTPNNRLTYRNSYVIGTSDPIRATYVATCCEPRVTISAFDIAGNQRSLTLDVRELYLTDAAIAAIVLGCILLLILIILIIMGIVYCCRRRKIILDMPTYRSHSTRSME